MKPFIIAALAILWIAAGAQPTLPKVQGRNIVILDSGVKVITGTQLSTSTQSFAAKGGYKISTVYENNINNLYIDNGQKFIGSIVINVGNIAPYVDVFEYNFLGIAPKIIVSYQAQGANGPTSYLEVYELLNKTATKIFRKETSNNLTTIMRNVMTLQAKTQGALQSAWVYFANKFWLIEPYPKVDY